MSFKSKLPWLVTWALMVPGSLYISYLYLTDDNLVFGMLYSFVAGICAACILWTLLDD